MGKEEKSWVSSAMVLASSCLILVANVLQVITSLPAMSFLIPFSFPLVSSSSPPHTQTHTHTLFLLRSSFAMHLHEYTCQHMLGYWPPGCLMLTIDTHQPTSTICKCACVPDVCVCVCLMRTGFSGALWVLLMNLHEELKGWHCPLEGSAGATETYSSPNIHAKTDGMQDQGIQVAACLYFSKILLHCNYVKSCLALLSCSGCAKTFLDTEFLFF